MKTIGIAERTWRKGIWRKALGSTAYKLCHRKMSPPCDRILLCVSSQHLRTKNLSGNWLLYSRVKCSRSNGYSYYDWCWIVQGEHPQEQSKYNSRLEGRKGQKHWSGQANTLWTIPMSSSYLEDLLIASLQILWDFSEQANQCSVESLTSSVYAHLFETHCIVYWG